MQHQCCQDAVYDNVRWFIAQLQVCLQQAGSILGQPVAVATAAAAAAGGGGVVGPRVSSSKLNSGCGSLAGLQDTT
jgi:hypothetical protein